MSDPNALQLPLTDAENNKVAALIARYGEHPCDPFTLPLRELAATARYIAADMAAADDEDAPPVNDPRCYDRPLL